MDKLFTETIANWNQKSPYELTYHLTPWSWYQLKIGVSKPVPLSHYLDDRHLPHSSSEHEITLTCPDHSLDAISMVNIFKNKFNLPELRLKTLKTRLESVVPRVLFRPAQVSTYVLLDRELTAQLVSHCHDREDTVTSALTRLFRKRVTQVAVATNLRPRLNLPAESLGNLSGGIIFHPLEKVTRATIKKKMKEGHDMKDIADLLNQEPARVIRTVINANVNILRGECFIHPELIVSNLGKWKIDGAEYIYFIPPTVP